MSKTSGGFESSGGPKMKEHQGYEDNGGPAMAHTSGGFESAPNNPVYGKEKGSRYPKGKDKQDSYFKTNSRDGEKGAM